MVGQSVPVLPGTLDSPRVRIVTLDHPWLWLLAGWRDLRKTPLASIAYGLVFVVMGFYLTSMVSHMFHMALALATGFLLVGPFLAMGLYDLSARLERGQPATFWHAVTAWRGKGMTLALFGMMVGLIMIVWARLSALLYAVLFLGRNIEVEHSVQALFFSGDGLRFLIAFTMVGAVLAALVFCISVVSIPMIMDRNCDFFTAIVTSLTAVRVNPGPMLLWAVLIVVITGVGLATFYLGLAITLPLVGHATWHAYRDVVE
ncbi:MAG TPA: DUF2189 domain-containing protein [Candidatus Competibacteraceae bacterium]|nr:DUF2189 domain-containing protein [Candidatus Competibacteraceae bacterium]